nr:MAG TPA: hypothetical protein [Caudoviricetes sp.]
MHCIYFFLQPTFINTFLKKPLCRSFKNKWHYCTITPFIIFYLLIFII